MSSADMSPTYATGGWLAPDHRCGAGGEGAETGVRRQLMHLVGTRGTDGCEGDGDGDRAVHRAEAAHERRHLSPSGRAQSEQAERSGHPVVGGSDLEVCSADTHVEA